MIRVKDTKEPKEQKIKEYYTLTKAIISLTALSLLEKSKIFVFIFSGIDRFVLMVVLKAWFKQGFLTRYELSNYLLLIMKKIKNQLVYDGYRKIIKKYYQLADGNQMDFDIVWSQCSASGIVALTPENNFILVKKFCPGMDLILYDMPGGHIDEGEDEQVAGMRELLEETGYVSNQVSALGYEWRNPYSNAKQYYYLAQNCTYKQAPMLEKGEELETIILTIDQLKSEIKAGTVLNSSAYFMYFNS